MNILIYDQTFEGLFTAILDAFELDIKPDKIISTKSYQDDLFATKHYISTDSEKFQKLWNQIKEKSNEQNCQRIFKAYLSELPNIEIIIYNYIKLIVETPYNVEVNFSDEIIIKLNNVQKKVGREAQRVMMFVRFQKTIDDIYYASFNPKFNVIPLTLAHFRNRFADQKWVIFDTKRKFGYYYDLENVHEITIGKQRASNESGKVDN
ncbi:TIGR03915 family putative DNA repair protein, partial [Bacteroidota bacterium]